ncbi:hypothetical protein [Streptacidiphilus rugosus]|uniref:hypothetical protein n=1 Tax=Streptacidiphilus rugosus TaxID=405783 RepID=UPI00056C2F3B|nr:hypothetical protein [Streptacidiphilus rugosus]
MTGSDPAQAEMAPTMYDTARAALRQGEQELAARDWHLYPKGIHAARHILKPVDALAEQRPSTPDPERETALLREALGALAMGVLHTENPLRRLLAAVCSALEPLVHAAANGQGVEVFSAEHRADADRVLQHLGRLLHTALAHNAPPNGSDHSQPS